MQRLARPVPPNWKTPVGWSARCAACPRSPAPTRVSQALQDRIHQTRQDRWRTAAKRWYKPLAAAAVLVLIACYHLFDPDPVPPAFSPKEVAQARRQVEWTLAYLGDLNSRLGTTVRDDVIQPHLVPTAAF